jgi:hypothetical protein
MVKVRSLDLRGVTPRPQPVRPGDLGSGGTPDDDERAWLDPVRRPAGQQTALLVGLAVVVVIVLAYRRFQREATTVSTF